MVGPISAFAGSPPARAVSVRGLTHFRRCDVKARHAITRERVVVQKLAQNSVKLGLRPKNALHGESPLYEVFHENTKLGRWSGRVYSARAAAFAQLRPGQTPLRGGKIYSLMDRRAL